MNRQYIRARTPPGPRQSVRLHPHAVPHPHAILHAHAGAPFPWAVSRGRRGRGIRDSIPPFRSRAPARAVGGCGNVGCRRALRVAAMISGDQSFGIRDVFGGLPCPLLRLVPLPIHKIPQLPSPNLRIQNLLHLIFRHPIHNFRRFWNRLGPPFKLVRVIWVQEMGVEDGVNPPLRGQS
jgi:hypothetical protein